MRPAQLISIRALLAGKHIGCMDLHAGSMLVDLWLVKSQEITTVAGCGSGFETYAVPELLGIDVAEANNLVSLYAAVQKTAMFERMSPIQFLVWNEVRAKQAGRVMWDLREMVSVLTSFRVWLSKRRALWRMQAVGVAVRPALFLSVWASLALKHINFIDLYASSALAAFWTSALGLLAGLLAPMPLAAGGTVTIVVLVALPFSTSMPAFNWITSPGASYLSGQWLRRTA